VHRATSLHHPFTQGYSLLYLPTMVANMAVLLAAVLVLATHTHPAAGRAAKYNCAIIRTDPSVTDATCPHGVVGAWCPGVQECGKGAGERCGGQRNKYGRCGAGMFCSCGVCNGCGRTLDCYFQPKC